MLILGDFIFIWLNIKLIHKFGFVPIRCSNMLDLFLGKKNETFQKSNDWQLFNIFFENESTTVLNKRPNKMTGK